MQEVVTFLSSATHCIQDLNKSIEDLEYSNTLLFYQNVVSQLFTVRTNIFLKSYIINMII